MANWWDSAPKVDPLDAALQIEGLDPQRAAIARSIYQQESSSGKNTATSNAGAVGGMQIIPDTFNRMADKGWNINDPLDNARAGVRYINRLYDLAGGDPRLTAAGYYGGEGAIPKAKAGIAVSDPRNPNAPNTLQYADQVAGRLPPDAAQSSNWWEAAPVVEAEQPKPQPAKPDVSDSSLVAIGAGLGKGVGTVALNAQNYLGKGMSAIGLDTPGEWLQQDATQGLKNLEGQVSPYKQVSPFATGAGELAGNIAATLPVGGVLAKGVEMAAPLVANAPTAIKLANALRSGGMTLGGAPAQTALQGAGNLALRAAGGAGTGYASAGLVNPDEAGMGAAVGGAFPLAARTVAAGSRALGGALRGGSVSQPVAQLAQRAEQLGINIPADRIANSKPLNALASSLEYVPFSGRAAVEDTMQSQLNRALTRTFGQDSENVTQALRRAADDLGQKFDDVLKGTAVKADDTLLSDLASTVANARDELTDQQFGVISRQVNNIMSKVKAGDVIDADAAYNIKKGLDRIGKSNDSSLAYYAGALKNDLMGALNRSLGPEDAQAFAKVRQQYGNMLSLQKLAQNGAEGDISIARLANMKNIRNPELQELADIAAQFLKPREGQHGAMQRVSLGALGFGVGGHFMPYATAGGIALGRALNSYLKSDTARNMVLGNSSNTALANALRNVLPVTARAAPVLTAQ